LLKALRGRGFGEMVGRALRRSRRERRRRRASARGIRKRSDKTPAQLTKSVWTTPL